MRDIMLVSRWFYPAGTSLLLWLAALAIAAPVLILIVWLCRGAVRRVLARTALALALAGALASAAMATAEIFVFEFGSPLSVACYAVLVAVFAWFAGQARSEEPGSRRRPAFALLLSAAALGYLFPFGALPSISELKPEMLAGVEGANLLGKPSGTLPIVEFADFECPACAMQEEALDKLWGTFPDRIRYSFRHLPWKNLHPYARPAAIASQCAAGPGRFWETKRLLFANQGRLGEILAHPVLPTIPAADAEQYARCVQSNAGDAEVRNDIRDAMRLRLTMTPSLVVGDKLIEGMITYPRLALIVKRELAARNLLTPQQARSATQAGCGAILEHACAP